MQSSVVAASAGCIRNTVTLNDPCPLTLISDAPDALGLLELLMKEKKERFRLETNGLKLSESSAPLERAFCRRWLRAGCKQTLQISMGKFCPYFPFSTTAICPF